MTDRVVKFEPPVGHLDKANLEGLTVLVRATSPEALTALREGFADIEGVDCAFDATGATPTAALAGAAKTPDVLFFEFEDEESAAGDIRRMRSESEGARPHFVALVPRPSKAGTIRLLLEGADDVLSADADGIELMRCLARANARAREAAEDIDVGPRIIVFLHAAGGAGATTLAVNSAVQLKQRLKPEEGGVCLIDFDLQFGDANLHLDIPLNSRLLDIVNAPERLDHRMLEDLMVDGPLGIRMLTAPDAPMPLDIFRSQTIDTILLLARRHYRYVIVDMPLALANWTETVLKRADHIFVVTQVNVTALRATRRLLDAIREEKATASPISVIANRYNRAGAQIPLPQAAKALGMPINAVTPSDYPLLVESLDQGVPASMLKPASKFSLSVSKALDRVVDHVAEPPKSGGFATSLFKFRR
ncbi:MAG: CpaE family protein [Amphiplicatus sp.]